MKCNVSDENSLNESYIKMGETEIRDLERFWDDLSWWERDESMEHAWKMVECALNPISSLTEVSDDLKRRCELVFEEVKMLNSLNNESRPSKLSLKISELQSKLGFVTYENDSDDKPNLRICLAIIPRLSNDILINLDKYLGVEEFVTHSRKHSQLSEDIYMEIFAEPGTSKAMFYAFRNYIGKHETRFR